MAGDKKRVAIVDELLDKPSSQAPHLFVGLGGAGCKLARRVADHLHARADFHDRYRRLVKFAFVDTNINDLEKHKEVADDVFLISNFEKAEYATLASGKGYLEADDYFTQWVPQDYRFRAGDTAGAGQIRIESRLGAYYQMKHGDFVLRFRKLLEDLKAHDDGYRRIGASEIRIILCYSVAGGTGSGVHLPMAYMLRDQAKQLGTPFVIGVAVMPSVFDTKVGDNKDGTYANGYAALKETEHLMRLGAPSSPYNPTDGIAFHYNPSDTTKRRVTSQPFEFLYIIDRPESFSVDEPILAAGDGLYLQLFTDLFGKQAGDYDNYTQHQRFLVPHDFEDKGIQGFTSYYGSYGAAVLHIPDKALLEYCSRVAAVDVLKASFLGGIPTAPEYAPLRAAPEQFSVVRETDEDGAAEYAEAELADRPRDARDLLTDRLFLKRVRLLANCEWVKNKHGVFAEAFVHGHEKGKFPSRSGRVTDEDGVDRVPGDAARQYESATESGWGGSIAAKVLTAIWSAEGVPRLLDAAYGAVAAIGAEAEARKEQVSDVATKSEFLSRAEQEAKQAGMECLTNGTEEVCGFSILDEKKFIDPKVTKTVSLIAKRYAALSLLEKLGAAYRDAKKRVDEYREKERVPQSAAEEVGVFAKVAGLGKSEEKARSAYLGDLPIVESNVKEQIEIEFCRRLISTFDSLRRYVGVFRGFQEAYESRRDEWETDIAERIQGSRGPATKAYILDSEALQIETGRRMWDFFYEDQIRGRDEVDFFKSEDLSGMVNEAILRGDCSSMALQKLYVEIVQYVGQSLKPAIVGDPTSVDDDDRYGFQLKHALEREVFYRALYLSNRKTIDGGKPGGVADSLMRYEIAKEEHRFDPAAPVHSDYLRDKIRRLVTEKANVLNYVDDKHLKQGGVRPDDVFLALIDPSYGKDKLFRDALKGTGEREPQLVDANDRKQIVFYRAILNVPLFVFARTKEMASFYHQFRKLKRQSKVLHIDRNWELSLPDLDPEVLEEERRMAFVRERIVDFAALRVLRLLPGGSEAIVRKDVCFMMRSPDVSSFEGGSDRAEGVDLGQWIREAVQKLPKVLNEQSVRFQMYAQLLGLLRKGLLPQVLQDIVKLPKSWRRSAQEFRNQYGAAPSADQRVRINDYLESAESLYEALKDLLTKIEFIETERLASGDVAADDLSVPQGVDRMQAIRESIVLLRAFKVEWEAPDKMRAIPDSLAMLFRPLSATGEKDSAHRTGQASGRTSGT